MIKTENKIKDYLILNPLVRSIKIFVDQTLKPFGIKLFVAIFTLIFILFFSVNLFKPELLSSSYKKVKFVIINFLNLNNYSFKEIKISGNKRVKDIEIIEIVKNYKQKILTENDHSQTLIQNLIDELKTKLPWIHKITITRNMPSNLIISIIEYEPFAIWHSDDRKYIIDREGNPVPYENIENESEFDNMIILSGKSANNHAKTLFNILAINPKLSEKIYSATWVGDRRWNIRFDNGLLVKLPEDEIFNAWQELIKIDSKGKIGDFKVIDLRITDKIYIEYNNNEIKELKS